MFAIVLTALLACASAAPHYRHSHHHGYGPPSPFGSRDEYDLGGFGMEPHFGNDNDFFRDNMFDTRRFWAELSREMSMLDQLLNDFAKRFPSGVSNEGIDKTTNEYKVTVALNGFEEQDIKVKAREGLLMIQAIRNKDEAGQNSYLSVRTLPDFVNVTGSWTYEDGVLKIVFPLISTPADGETTTEITTEIPEQFKPESREETTIGEDTKDADVGLDRGDVAKETELLTNEIPRKEAVEATTYAVDLKDEVEFVPVRY
ncbi:uncharacterized protein LOC106716039 [Papilio machaon]|uniref:uncharacterized protein LOC106716039 n=1 Tax=Papilio machaon TaxID=76193 RepID=UPI001E665B67|nr:uncharacterized protein LOC106716039 [Papilio machaon]